jgi:hypothetical protein
LLDGFAHFDPSPHVGQGDFLRAPFRKWECVQWLSRSDQEIHRFFATKGVNPFDFGGTAAEAGTVQEVSGFKDSPGWFSLREHGGISWLAKKLPRREEVSRRGRSPPFPITVASWFYQTVFDFVP